MNLDDSNKREQGGFLSVRELRTAFHQNGQAPYYAVDGIDLDVCGEEVHSLVGESGCGKTVACLSLLRLIPPPGSITSGKIIWNNKDLLGLSAREMRHIRGKEIAMIMQNPQMALLPQQTIGSQIAGILRLHQGLSSSAAKNEAVHYLDIARIPNPSRRYHSYPNELSGGMCQRALIAMALSCRPKVLLADEPTAALDVTVQSQIIDLLLEIKETFNMSILLVSHDMGVVARTSSRVSVMYLGQIVESSTAEKLFTSPKHPYTRALLAAVPLPDPRASYPPTIQGDIPSADQAPNGCRFHPRCPEAFDRCRQEIPLSIKLDEGQTTVACWLYDTTH